jgi:hypothetical protein
MSALFSKNGQIFPKKWSVNFGGVDGLPEENYEGYFCSLHYFMMFTCHFDQKFHIKRSVWPIKIQL